MYYSWLDRWDERSARSGDAVKIPTEFKLGPEHCFSNAADASTIEEFSRLSKLAMRDPYFFWVPSRSKVEAVWDSEYLKFESDVETCIVQNNTVWTKVTSSRSSKKVLVVFHHWNATNWNGKLARFLASRGTAVAEIAMPYHFQRSRPESSYADYMLSPNLGRTIQSLRQGVLDGRKLILWLTDNGYQEISVLGISLGSWVAGLVAAHDSAVRSASLFLSAGSLADMVWTGRATRAIRNTLEDSITLSELRSAWDPLNLERYSRELARSDLRLQLVLAKRDNVVRPEVSERFIAELSKSGASPAISNLNCGHYSLAMPPHVLVAGSALQRFLRNR